MTAPGSDLSKSLDHIEDISNQLTKNDNITVTLANFRESSEKLKNALDKSVSPDLEATISNTKDFTATLAHAALAHDLAEHEEISGGRGHPNPGAQGDPGKITSQQSLALSVPPGALFPGLPERLAAGRLGAMTPRWLSIARSALHLP